MTTILRFIAFILLNIVIAWGLVVENYIID